MVSVGDVGGGLYQCNELGSPFPNRHIAPLLLFRGSCRWLAVVKVIWETTHPASPIFFHMYIGNSLLLSTLAAVSSGISRSRGS